MKKIIILISVIMICAGCQARNIEKNNKEKKKEISLVDELNNYELIDYNIKDDIFVAIVYSEEKTNFFVYSLQKKELILIKNIYEGFLPRAKIIVIKDGYVLDFGQGSILTIYNNDFNLVKTIELSKLNPKKPYQIAAVSQDMRYLAFLNDENVLCLMDLENENTEKVMSLYNNINELSIINKLAFLDENTLCFTGGTYLYEGVQNTGCYGTIDIDAKTYTKTNSSAVTLSSYEDKVLIHNEHEPIEVAPESCSFYFNGKNGISLDLSLQDSINALMTVEGLLFLNSGSKGDYTPEIKIENKILNTFDENYEYISNAIYYRDHFYILGYVDGKNRFCIMEDIL